MQSLLNLPIGVIDSGIGGLSVLDKLVKKFPLESFIYYGDNEYAPYGNKPIPVLLDRFDFMVERLSKKGIKGLVIACNTLSTHLYKEIKNRYPFFVVPTFPPVVKGEGVYLACTSNTAKSQFALQNYKNNIIPFSDLAKIIENNVFNLNALNLFTYFEDYIGKIKTLVLGCTHYSFISENLHSLLGADTVDGYSNILNSVERELSNGKILSNNTQSITFLGNSKSFNKKVFKRVFCHTGGYELKKN